jgi:hypothetical protein
LFVDDEDTIRDAVDHISAVQHALTAFVGSIPENGPLATDPHIVTLKTETGEKATVRPLLQEYNTRAVQLNALMQSKLGSLTASITKENQALLPYLEIDGTQDFKPTIHL